MCVEDMDDHIIPCAVFPLVIMVYASACDVRTREVPDACWALVCAGGSAPLVLCCPGPGSPFYLAGCILLASYMLSPRLVGVVGASVFVASVMMFVTGYVLDPGGRLVTAGLAVPAMFLLFLGMYKVGLLAGGADAKCLMSIAMALPLYPDASPLLVWQPAYPGAYVINPSVSILVLALVLTLVWGLRILVRNVRDRNFGRGMLSSYRMDVDDVGDAFVWPVERVVDGHLVRTGPCSNDEVKGVLDGLRSAGAREVRVTPMVPFVLPLTVAAVLTVVFGSPLSVI